MKICIESQLLNHHHRSGLLTYAEGLLDGLKENDAQNEYLLAYYSLTRSSSQMPGPEKENFKKFVLKIPDRPFIGRQWLLDEILLPSFLKHNKCSVFHRPSGYTMPSVKNVFKILTVHDLRTLTIGDKLWAQDITYYKKTLNALDMCVVVSECTKRDLLKNFSMDERKIKVIYLGADKRFRLLDTPVVESVLSKYGIKRPYLLSVGSVPRKNINGIIKGFYASKASDNFQLVLSCSMDVSKYQQMADDLGVGDRVLILSSLSDQELVALYNGCHAFVFPSLYEGFGLPILEAMQCGAPVITSNISSCPEVAADAAILVDPGSTRKIAAAIDQMCSDDILRKQFIEKGFQRAKHFSWDRFAQEMKKVYSSV
jgi:glycosyltransferase involved in cell wall biosynthesis